MKDIRAAAGALMKRVRARGCVLMLDYDGTLSPIVSDPRKAAISRTAKEALKKAVRTFPVAVISGRPLADVRRRVGVPGITYAGSHGQEWRIGSRSFRFPLPRASEAALREATRILTRLARTYPGLVAERKPGCFALNYRALSRRQQKAFRNEARESVRRCLESGVLRLLDDMQTFEVMPAIEWTKGHVARLIYRSAGTGRTKRIPIYIGDSATDEDAFKAFREGITIRVGKKAPSAARYYFDSRREVDRFILALAANLD